MSSEKWNTLAIVAGVLVLAIGGPWIVGQVRSLPHARTLAARADQRIVTLDVGGLTCANCAASVGKSLAAVPGVAACDVRYSEHRAYVVCARGVADSTLTAAVHRAGPGFLAAVSD
jgi:copper chaperone CopZ